MMVATIATVDWLELHVRRWLRYVRAAMPDAKVGLVLYCGSMDQLDPETCVAYEFDALELVNPAQAGMLEFDRVRMSMTELFRVEQCLYVDADADVYDDLSDLFEYVGDRSLLWVPSPVVNKHWLDDAQRLGYGVPKDCANNGLLVLRKDWGAEWAAAVEKCGGLGKDGKKTHGLTAFNAMLKDNPDLHHALPPETSVTWFDVDRWGDARVLQYCGKHGQELRIGLEAKWKAMEMVKGLAKTAHETCDRIAAEVTG